MFLVPLSCAPVIFFTKILNMDCYIWDIDIICVIHDLLREIANLEVL